MSGPKGAGLKEFYCVFYHTTQHNIADDYNLDYMRRQKRSEGSKQMTNGNTKDEKSGKIQIQNTAQKRLNTHKGNTYGKIKKYRKCYHHRINHPSGNVFI